MKKHLKKNLGAVPGGAAVSVAGGASGAAWGGSGGAVVPWWLCALVGIVLLPLIVIIVQNVRDMVRLAKANR
ncbi:hypothetical protein OG746_45350 [Streptomyces sp. NBC_01016]|uniref:hypothetical protein n=1 Tax=Streptomyces sp. NBC_01016 TaxID=2903720 RepID=UPI002253CB10|nr:hypothetical protein [Streptomyces sp. NBC_01016]MCX4832316.1 hypothetical protein [Streptomyces sp. NBC_01016]MCX4835940.1 hypothetical protein [Streptomyces sp. NBC_01016]